MRNMFWVKAGSFLLAAPLLLFSACGAAGPSKTTSTAPRDPKIVTYSASARVQQGQTASVSASCQSGGQMIGGGFAAGNLFEYAAYIEASYPSDTHTWTVTGEAPASYFDLTAEVYCVSAPLSLGVQIVQGADGRATCPNGTRLLSGGFQGSDPVATSYPVENGWLGASSDQVSILCARQHVTGGWVVTASFNPHLSTSSYQPGDGKVACPAGQFASGGGFAGQGALILSSIRSEPGWFVNAGGDSAVTVYALCAALNG